MALADASEIRAAVVGLGKLGLLHAATFNVLPGCRLVAVVDTNKTVMNSLKSYFGELATFSHHDKMLDVERPDIVAIATPTGLHVPVAVDCVRRGVPVLIEKPLSLDAGQASPLLQALAERPVVNMVGYMTRFLETYRKAKEIIASGALGAPQMLRCSMYIGQLFGKGKGWRYDKGIAGGGVLTTQNSHLIDMLLWYFGDIEWVSAHTSALYSSNVEDHAHVFFSFRSGLKGFLDASWSARHFRKPTMAVHVQGDNGTLDVDDDQVRLFLETGRTGLGAGWSTWRKPDLYKGTTFDIGGPNYTLQAEQFLGAVRGTDKVESDVASAYKVQCVIDAAYRSAGQNGAAARVAAGAGA